jgi:hypothetical protein
MGLKKIIPQMFDIRPVDESGDLHWEKINNVGKNPLNKYNKAKKEPVFSDEIIPEETFVVKKIDYAPQTSKVYQFGEIFESGDIPVFQEGESVLSDTESENEREVIIQSDIPIERENENEQKEIIFSDAESGEEMEFSEKNNELQKEYDPEIIHEKWEGNAEARFRLMDFFIPSRFAFGFKLRKAAFSFAGIAFFVLVMFASFSFVSRNLGMGNKIQGLGKDGYANLALAMENIKNQDFKSSSQDFEKSYSIFSEASGDLNANGGFLLDLSKYIPFVSKVSSGKNAIEAGKHISLAGSALNSVIENVYSTKSSLAQKNNGNVSLLDVYQTGEKDMKTASDELKETQKYLDMINIEDLPQDKQAQFLKIKNSLPEINGAIGGFLNNSDIFMDLFGGNGPRKYLFLFQNNNEMRATGGFIGSYGLLDISQGHIRNFFIDGIFNPDGQLIEKVVPPNPIQKISAAWSLHDSNWFPDFPTSAKKAISFYEKTGGPTADGILTLTPTVIQKLLEVTGPIEMKDYAVTLDANNFIAATQNEVEIDYDKKSNNPKKILSDLAPILLDKIVNGGNMEMMTKAANVFLQGLNEKQILLYSENKNLQKIISDQGWSGEIMETPKDYLSVINSNLNGFKTDGVIDEKIEHKAEIQEDGTIVDTVTITRHHNGGNTGFSWWDKVNANYMRVYVPQGSKLLEAEGQINELVNPPLDYDALGFKRDGDVQKEEENMTIDEKTGTRISEESGKTVFGNWTYVSPQETTVIKYKYLLPFKVVPDSQEKLADAYSLLAQKQSGSIGSALESEIDYPRSYKSIWNYPADQTDENGAIKTSTDLKNDKFIGVAFGLFNQ